MGSRLNSIDHFLETPLPHENVIAHATASLYVVATPIGNLRDISLRALDILSAVDVIAAEDTRNTRHLLDAHGITTRLVALHQHNEQEAAQKILALLRENKSVALVSDAGTPAVSDPGALCVQAVREAGFPVVPIPGANAAVAALSAAGMVETGFLFAGFLPARSAGRKKILQQLANLPQTLVFYEAPHRIVEFTQDCVAVFGDRRKIVFARELTKLFEQFHACDLADALAWLQADVNHQRGEFVVLVQGANAAPDDSAEGARVLRLLLAELPLKQAASLAAQITGAKRNALYQLALELKAENPE
ncbi:MAG: 16S rRNA (cytidine(1402)-2'-O)-methyltransferase [Burkholderiales bacterium]